MRFWLIDLPARIVDALYVLYLVVLAGAGVTCLIVAGLWLVLGLLGFPLP